MRTGLQGHVARALTLDVSPSSVDVFEGSADGSPPLLAVSAGRAAYLFHAAAFHLLAQFGRRDGGLHRRNVRVVRFAPAGRVLATAGDDCRVILWDVKAHKSIAALHRHKDAVYDLRFSADGASLFSCSADGTTMQWNVKSRLPTRVYMRQLGTVVSLDGCAKTGRLATASTDGSVAVWDVEQRELLGLVAPEDDGSGASHVPARPSDGAGGTGSGPPGRAMPVRPAVRAVCLSADGHYMLTACSDDLCRLWSILSFGRDAARLAPDEARVTRRGADYINIAADEFGAAADAYSGAEEEEEDDGVYRPRGDAARARHDADGDEPIDAERRAVLVHQFYHDAPPTAVAFSVDSCLAFTAAHDFTTRSWGTESGALLFQINTPVAVTAMQVTNRDVLVAACGRKVLLIALERDRAFRDVYEEEWDVARATDGVDDDGGLGPNAVGSGHVDLWGGSLFNEAGMQRTASNLTEDLEALSNALKPTVFPLADVMSMQFPFMKAERKRLIKHGVRQSDLRRILAHGSFAPTFLATMLAKKSRVNLDRLEGKMTAHGVRAVALLHAIADCHYAPTDVLTALMDPRDRAAGDELFHCIRVGGDIDAVMDRLGFSPVAPELRDSLVVLKLSELEVDQMVLYSMSEIKRKRTAVTLRKVGLLEQDGGDGGAQARDVPVPGLFHMQGLSAILAEMDRHRRHRWYPGPGEGRFVPPELRVTREGRESLARRTLFDQNEAMRRHVEQQNAHVRDWQRQHGYAIMNVPGPVLDDPQRLALGGRGARASAAAGAATGRYRMADLGEPYRSQPLIGHVLAGDDSPFGLAPTASFGVHAPGTRFLIRGMSISFNDDDAAGGSSRARGEGTTVRAKGPARGVAVRSSRRSGGGAATSASPLDSPRRAPLASIGSTDLTVSPRDAVPHSHDSAVLYQPLLYRQAANAPRSQRLVRLGRSMVAENSVVHADDFADTILVGTKPPMAGTNTYVYG